MQSLLYLSRFSAEKPSSRQPPIVRRVVPSALNGKPASGTLAVPRSNAPNETRPRNAPGGSRRPIKSDLTKPTGETRSVIGWYHLGRPFSMPSQCGAAAERRTRDREVPGSELACAIWFSLSARKLVGIARWPSSLVVLIGPSSHHCSPIGRAPIQSSEKRLPCVRTGDGKCSPGSSRLSRFAGSRSQGSEN